MDTNGYDAKRRRFLSDLEAEEGFNEGLKGRFMELVNDMVFSLLHKDENFFGSFMVQVDRTVDPTLPTGAGIRLDLSGLQFVFNPRLMAELPLACAKAEIKHQIYHLVTGHPARKKSLAGRYDNRILNVAADIAIDQYIEDLPPWEPTLESVSREIGRRLPPYLSMEAYAERIQQALDSPEAPPELSEEEKKAPAGEEEDREGGGEGMPGKSDGKADAPEEEGDAHDEDRCHELWQESEAMALEEADAHIRRLLDQALRGEVPSGLEEAVERLCAGARISWQRMLRNLAGTLPAPHRKTITRKDRRQPWRLDLRGRLPRYETELVVAVDTSGSMDNVALKKAVAEIFELVKHTRHKVTLIECDADLQRIYRLERPSDLRTVFKGRGGTAFSPVFRYLRENNLRDALLVYFTDGQGETALSEKPVNKHTLWVLTGKGDLSLEAYPGHLARLGEAERSL